MTQIKIILSFYGDIFDHSELTEKINIKPTTFWTKGETLKHRKDILRKETAWEYSTDFIETLDLEQVCDLILDKFYSKKEVISNYLKTNQL